MEDLLRQCADPDAAVAVPIPRRRLFPSHRCSRHVAAELMLRRSKKDKRDIAPTHSKYINRAVSQSDAETEKNQSHPANVCRDRGGSHSEGKPGRARHDVVAVAAESKTSATIRLDLQDTFNKSLDLLRKHELSSPTLNRTGIVTSGWIDYLISKKVRPFHILAPV